MKKFHFGRNLRDIREDLEIKQETVATELHISQSSYSRIEDSSEPPNEETRLKIAKILSVKPQELLYRSVGYGHLVIRGLGLQESALYIFHTPLGSIMKFFIAFALANMAGGLASGACSAAETSPETAMILKWVAGILMAGLFYYWTRGLTKKAVVRENLD